MVHKEYVFYTSKQDYNMQPQAFNVLDNVSRDAFIREHKDQDTYYTPNTFKEPTSKTKDNIATLKVIAIDVDNHLDPITLTDAYNYVGLLEPYFNSKIPTPNKIVYSGRGLHVYIDLEPTKDIAKYELVSRELLKLYDKVLGEIMPLTNVKLSTDHKAMGVERYLRVVGTLNTKSHTVATEIKRYNASYDLDLLIDGFLEPLKNIKNNTDAIRKEYAQATGSIYKAYRKEFSLSTWLYAGIEDLKHIQTQREQNVRLNGSKYIIGNEGYRNVMLFMYGLMCKWAFNDSQAVLDSMIAFNTYYAHGVLPEREVMATYKSVISKNYKAYSSKRIISLLEITQEEMQELKVLIDKTEVKRRTVNRVKRYKQNKATERIKAKEVIKSKAIELHNAGLSYRAIAEQLNVSHMTVCRYFK